MSGPPLIDVEFGDYSADPSLPYATISAITDMALSTAGATVTDLDLCDTALRELLDALQVSGPLSGASIEPTSGVLEIRCAQPPIQPTPSSLELIELGFRDLVLSSTGIQCSFARLRSEP